jgi:hypothetical protein
MAVATFLRFERLTPERYNRLVVSLELDANLPPGHILHVAAEVEDGFDCCDLWWTKEAAIAFLEQRFRQALVKVGVDPPAVRIAPLYNLYAPDVEAIQRLGPMSLPAGLAAALL